MCVTVTVTVISYRNVHAYKTNLCIPFGITTRPLRSTIVNHYGGAGILYPAHFKDD